MQNDLRKLVKLMLESEQLTPGTIARQQREEIEAREISMRKLSRELADKLDLLDVRYLSRSKRPKGAYTFSAVDDKGENVVLKIQPSSELGGYIRMQRLLPKLPDEVRRHVPVIMKVRTLSELGIKIPDDDVTSSEVLGVIVMERLENLPGNMFDLITEPPLQSAKSLSALISDRETLKMIIEKTIKSSSHILSRFFSDYGSLHRKLMNNLVERLMLLNTRARQIVNPEGDRQEEFYKLREALVEIVNQWYDNVEEWVRDNRDEPGLNQKQANDILGRPLRSMTVAAIRDNFTGQLGKRAVPINPSESLPGSLAGLAGIKEFQNAVESLRKMGIHVDDVHGNNIMVRPETGELVLSDLGHFW